MVLKFSLAAGNPGLRNSDLFEDADVQKIKNLDDMELPEKKSPEDIPRLMQLPFAYGVTLLYVLLSGFWIYFSDRLMVLLAGSPERLLMLSTGKGWFFIFITALFLFCTLLRFTGKMSRTQRQLRTEAEKYSTTLKSIGDGVIVSDAQGRVKLLNPVAESLTGWTSNEARGRSMEEVFHIINEETREKVENPTAKVIREGIIVGLANHTLLIAKDGTERPIADSGAPIRDEHGKITGVVLVFGDQTEERRGQMALHESNERLQTILDSIDAVIYVADLETYELLFVNDYVRRIFGDNVVGRPCYQVLQGKDSPCTFCSNEKLLTEDGKAAGIHKWELQNRIDHRWYDVRDNAVQWLDGRLVKLEIASDITDRKKMEEALQESERDLRRAQTMARIGSWRFDLNSGIAIASEEAYRIYGLNNQGSLSIKDIQDAPLPEYRAALDSSLEQLIHHGKPYDIEFRICRASDKEIRNIHSVAEYDAEKNLVVGTIHDITERVKLESQLRQSHKMESVGRLAGGVAHDFNNMLSVILGHAELAMEDTRPDDARHTHLSQILQAAQRSADMTRQLLAFARKQTISPKILDFNEAITGLLNMLRRLIGEDIDLSWQSASGVWPVRMDPAQIDQILANLCVNARDSIKGVGKITIETGTMSFDEDYCDDHPGFLPGDYVMLAVSDNGCGMDKETLDKLFEPFFTTKDMGKGTGLGLSMVYGIVKQNNGFINVYSEPGQGTTFRIYLPRHRGMISDISPEKVRHIPKAQGETVLIVEDESAILELGLAMLEKLGYKVLTAGTPGEALQLADAHPHTVDLLITDVVMPEMNGRDLAGGIAASYPQIKILFMSGYTANVIAHHGVLDEGVNFLQKPFSVHELAVKARQALES
jgi:PAS domain S-box-containing protein